MDQTVWKIAVPTNDGQSVEEHFGHCNQFAICYIKDNVIDRIDYVEPPVHTPGAFPKFLGEQGAKVIITGGMGQRAVDLFKEQGIDVILGAAGDLRENVNVFLSGNLESSDAPCTHDHG